MLIKQVILLTLGGLMVSGVNVKSLKWEDWVHCNDGAASTIPPHTVYSLGYKGIPAAYVYNNCDYIAGFNNDQYCQMKRGLASVDGFSVKAGCLSANSIAGAGGCYLNCHGGVCTCTNK